jgi:hypothetical protein
VPTPFLALNYKNGTTPQARRYVGGAAAVQGVTFGALESASPVPLADQASQRVARFAGHSTWVTVVRDTIYRSTDGGASYGTVFGPDSDLSTASSKAGPHLSYPGGVATLSIPAKTAASGTHHLFTSTDGVSWVKTGPFALTSTTDAPFASPVLWRDSWYAYAGAGGASGGTNRILVWSPGTLTVSQITFSVDAPRQSELSFCVFNDRLFWIQQNLGSVTYSLYELTGGSQTLRHTFSGPTAQSINIDCKFSLFVDQTTNEMIACLPASVAGVGTWFIFKIDGALAVTDITSTVAFASVFGAPPTPAAASTGRIASMVDVPQNNGTSPAAVFLGYAPNGTDGTSFTWAKWNGVGSPITSFGSGGDVAQALPWGVQNGGSVFWTSGQRHIERFTSTPIAGGVEYAFRIYSPNPTVDAVEVRWIKGTNVQESPQTPYASLANPSAGSISGGNTITGLDASDDGVTLFMVQWLAEADGFAIGDYAKTTPEIKSP